MSDWITVREAAEILGVHISAVPKMVRRGDLTPRKRRPRLRRVEVEALRDARLKPRPSKQRRTGPKPPDEDHDWLLAPAAAAVFGCSVVAVRARAVRGRVPSTLHDGRRWFRLDHIELVVRAQVARQRGQVAR
jgi:excisionase family DNA binding protein